MTISVTIPRSGPFNGDGSTVAFSYGFLIDADTEIEVVVADAAGDETIKTLNTDYTVSGVGNNLGGTVTFTTAPTATETISMRRITAQDQGVDLQNRGAVVPQVLEDTFDEVVKMVQDLQEQVSRAVLLRVTANTTGINIPAPQADRVLGWNAAGTNLENKTPNTSTLITLPGSVSDNRIVRFDGTSGAAFQESLVEIDDSGNLTAGSVYLDRTNTRVGIGTVTPAQSVDIEDSAPVIRLRDTDQAASAVTLISQIAAGFWLDIDPSNVDASSQLQVNVDGGAALVADGSRVSLFSATLDRALRIQATDAIRAPVGTTAQRPGTPEEGDFRRNSQIGQWEGYDGTSWGSLGGAGLFKGENGESGDTVTGAGDIFRVHEQTLNTNTTIDGDENSLAAGPLTIASGITLTISSGGNLVIV